MAINANKSCSMRVGQRFDVTCRSITSLPGVQIPWVDKMRYLGVFIVQSRLFKCSLDNAKKAFYRCANAVFGKIGRIASEEVTLEITRCKCIPVLLYGTEACLLNKSDSSSLDFVINRLFMKLFKTNNVEIVELCQYQFGFENQAYYGRNVSVHLM